MFLACYTAPLKTDVLVDTCLCGAEALVELPRHWACLSCGAIFETPDDDPPTSDGVFIPNREPHQLAAVHRFVDASS